MPHATLPGPQQHPDSTGGMLLTAVERCLARKLAMPPDSPHAHTRQPHQHCSALSYSPLKTISVLMLYMPPNLTLVAASAAAAAAAAHGLHTDPAHLNNHMSTWSEEIVHTPRTGAIFCELLACTSTACSSMAADL